MKASRGTLSLSAKSVHTQDLLTQKVIARWDNEGGAGPDGPQESHSRAGASETQGTASSEISHRWSQSLSGRAHVLIRPLTKLDASAHRAFFDGLSPATKRMRFLGTIQQLSDAFIAQMTDVDGINQVALAAVVKDGAAETIVGISRYSKIAGQNRCESALAVSDDWQHNGVGTALMRHLIELAKAQGLASVESTEFAENIDMRSLLHALGFHLKADSGNASQVLYTLDLLAINEPGRISQPAQQSMEKTRA